MIIYLAITDVTCYDKSAGGVALAEDGRLLASSWQNSERELHDWLAQQDYSADCPQGYETKWIGAWPLSNDAGWYKAQQAYSERKHRTHEDAE